MKSLKEMTAEERWELFPIILKEYNPEYPHIYKDIEKGILDMIYEYVIRINHIGSTSVPNLLAKPTIDVLIEIKKDTNLDDLKQKLEELGYLNSNHDKNPFHMMFLKGYTEQGFIGQVQHIHVHYHEDWDELYFCEYLRLHPEVCQEYTQLKLDLEKMYKNHRDNYTNGKTEFVKKHTELARKELNDKYKKVTNK